MIKKIQEAGFKISAQKEVNLTKELASTFYSEHDGKEFFDSLTNYMSRYLITDIYIVLSIFTGRPYWKGILGENIYADIFQ